MGLKQSDLYFHQAITEDLKNPLGTLRKFLKFKGEREPLSFSLIEMPTFLPTEQTLRQSLLLEAVEMDPFQSKESQLEGLLSQPALPVVSEILQELKNLDLYPHQVESEDLAWVSLLKGILRQGQFLFYVEAQEIPVANHDLWYRALISDPRPLLIHSPYGEFWRSMATHELMKLHHGRFSENKLRSFRVFSQSDKLSPLSFRKAV